MRLRPNLLREMAYGVCFAEAKNLIGKFNGTTLSGSQSARKSIYLLIIATLTECYSVLCAIATFTP